MKIEPNSLRTVEKSEAYKWIRLDLKKVMLVQLMKKTKTILRNKMLERNFLKRFKKLRKMKLCKINLNYKMLLDCSELR
jgi:hypothetical protein